MVVSQPLLNRVTEGVGNMVYLHDCFSDVTKQYILTRPIGLCKISVEDPVYGKIRTQGSVPRRKGDF